MRRPAPSSRTTFQASYFDALVVAWQALPQGGPMLLIEDSLWAYLMRMDALVAPDLRVALRGRLAALGLPTLTFVLHTLGHQVALHHPQHRNNPDAYVPFALAQM